MNLSIRHLGVIPGLVIALLLFFPAAGPVRGEEKPNTAAGAAVAAAKAAAEATEASAEATAAAAAEAAAEAEAAIEAVEAGAAELETLMPPSLIEELRRDPRAFYYRQTDRPDPFMPFVTIRPTAPPSGAGAAATHREEEEVLTGLRRFEPEQLTLTAIVVGAPAPLAMVEDSTGYGHIIRPGSAIGRSGKVERITADRVIIRQQITLLTGDREYRTVEMVLTKEEKVR